jgi:hypothetical protein
MMKKLLILSLFLLVITMGNSAFGRDLFSWNWEVSCLEIEKAYGKVYLPSPHTLTYDFKFMGRKVKVKFYCHGAFPFIPGRLYQIRIRPVKPQFSRKNQQKYCAKINIELSKIFGPHRSIRGSGRDTMWFYERKRRRPHENTGVNLNCGHRSDYTIYIRNDDKCQANYCPL